MRLILFSMLFAYGQVFSQVIVRVNDAEPVKLEASNLAELPRQVAVLNDHGKQVNYALAKPAAPTAFSDAQIATAQPL